MTHAPTTIPTFDYDRYYRSYYYGYAVNYANLSSSPGVTLHTTGHGNLYYEALLASYNRVTEEVEIHAGIVLYRAIDYVDDTPAILDPRNSDFTLNFIGPANATTIESFLRVKHQLQLPLFST